MSARLLAPLGVEVALDLSECTIASFDQRGGAARRQHDAAVVEAHRRVLEQARAAGAAGATLFAGAVAGPDTIAQP